MELPFVLATIGGLWWLRQSGRLTIRLAAPLTGLGVVWIVLFRGVAAGVSAEATLMVAVFAWLLVSATVAAYLHVWSARGGTINGQRLRW